jgi:hypothetical protein
MIAALTALLAAVRSTVGSRLALQAEILALRHQLAVLQRQAPHRRRLRPVDRLLWVVLARVWPEWRTAVHIVTPDTVVRWHRRMFALTWRWKSRPRRLGRPALGGDVRKLIQQMQAANPLWGAPRIHGELQKLGLELSQATVARAAEADAAVNADRRVASRSAFNALGLRLLGGRWFSADDREGTPLVAVVNHTMAQQLWRGRSAVGQQLIDDGGRIRLVVGVVIDVLTGGARKEARPTFYVPTGQVYPDPVLLVVRKAPDAVGVESLVASGLAKVGSRIEPGSPRPLAVVWWRQVADARFLTLVVSVFSLLAPAIALVGVHGVLCSSVAQRTREMGIRKALGAPDSALIALVVGKALRFTLPACIVGLVATWAAAPGIRSLLFGITPTDPLTLVRAAALLVAAVVIAAYFPARRASAVDPSVSLRCE